MIITCSTLRKFHERYKNGEFSSPDYDTQVSAGWTDWLCQDKELPSRQDALWEILGKLTNDQILDGYRVEFENDIPARNPAYDSIMFLPTDQDDFLDRAFLVSVDDKREPFRFVVRSPRNNYKPEAGFDSLDAIVSYIDSWNPTAGKYTTLYRHVCWIGIRKVECYEERLFRETSDKYVRTADYPVTVSKSSLGIVHEVDGYLELWMRTDDRKRAVELFEKYCLDSLDRIQEKYMDAKNRFENALVVVQCERMRIDKEKKL